MSYDIYIGEARLERWDEVDGPIEATVEKHKEKTAPKFPGDRMTGNGNSRHPGYAQWGAFCDATGLRPLFFAPDTGLMREHPGCQPLHSSHLATVRAALDRWRTQHPDAAPGWCSCAKCDQWTDDKEAAHAELDGDYARLLWLEWWMDWAITNCKMPAIYNR